MLHWAEGELLGFELETTGTDAQQDVLVSYAFVNYDQGLRTEARCGLINPGQVIPDGLDGLSPHHNPRNRFKVPI